MSCKQQLEELLDDPRFQGMLELVAKEVMRLWNFSHKVAHSFVLSAIGEPKTLADIHDAWFLARATNVASPSFGLAKVIVRRRVIDLLRKDASA